MDVATTHLENMMTDRDRHVTRAVNEELLSLALRRAEQHQYLQEEQ